jgi:hypothetical protein
MSFEVMKKADLLEVVDKVGGVDISPNATNKSIIAALLEAGITWPVYKKLYLGEEEVPEELKPARDMFNNDSSVLVKMERQNPTFEIRGFKFTKQHPYVVVSQDEAQEIIDSASGFRLATPKEVRSYYG